LLAVFVGAGWHPQGVSPSGGALSGPGPVVDGCPVLPADNIWNTPVDALPIHSLSDSYISSLGTSIGLHPDFGSGLWHGRPIGIPFTTVAGSQPKVEVRFDHGDSDPGPYPLPPDAPIEGDPSAGGDRHVLVVDRDNCVLYELFYAFLQPDGSWSAGSGAVFPLFSNALRRDGSTSADLAGLPILPGLVRYEEVQSGQINHALRFTAETVPRAYVWPARHRGPGGGTTSAPPPGTRVRLKAGFDISSFSPKNQVILNALKRYGMMLADQGSAWYVTGVPDVRWDNRALRELQSVTGDNFEVVDSASLMADPDSGQVATGAVSPSDAP